LARVGKRAWIYREGKDRAFWVLETSASWPDDPEAFSSEEDRLAYARGYFDAEGGIPRSSAARFYVQFVQKNLADISELRSMLLESGIRCGKLHNPSRLRDPDLWRFYVVSPAHRLFIEKVSSWHPRKRGLLDARLGSEHQDEEIVHAPWRHGDLREQGSRSGSCGWITSFLGSTV
jgi:hypothetical protein